MAARQAPGVMPDNVAYVIYTSGSTGRPKGVVISHRNAVALFRWAADVYDADELSGVLASTSVCFDLSVFEIFLPLAMGGTVVLSENALALPEVASRHPVRLVNTVPSAMSQLVRQGRLPPSVRTVNLAGEPLKRSLADQVYASGATRLWDLYGPSEDTTYSTGGIVPAGSDAEPTIGRPIQGTEAWLLDDQLRPVPEPGIGELYLTGEGVTRGYLGRPGLTADRYLPDPFSGRLGSRMYRTGDLARRTPSGELQFLGRVDHQVKIRGYRIELGEVEAVLSRHPSVGAAVVVPHVRTEGDTALVAYVEPVSQQRPRPTALREWLSDTLPAYMVPSTIIVLEALPLTPNGKIDRAALPSPETDRSQLDVAYTAPRSERETELASLWSDLLEIDRVGADDDFLMLGGHSLTAARMLARVEQRWGVPIGLDAFFQRPTVAGLSAALDDARGDGSRALPALRPGTGALRGPLTAMQEDSWFTEHLVPGTPMYNVPLRFRISGVIDVGRLEDALGHIVERHEALRTAIVEHEGEPMAEVAAPYGVTVAVEDLRQSDPAGREDECRRMRLEEAARPIDSSTGRLVRASWVALDERSSELLVTVHHAGFDGWSTALLVSELAAELSGRPPAVAPRVQPRDHLAWRSQVLDGGPRDELMGYWRSHLDGADLVLGLPTDHARPAGLSFSGARLSRPLDADLISALEELGRAEGSSLFVTVLCGLAVLIGRLTGRDDLVLGTQAADRARPEVEGSIGAYINTLPVRLDVGGDPTFRQLLARTRRVALGALAHQDLSYIEMIRGLRTGRSLEHAALVQVILAVQNYAIPRAELPDLRIDYLEEVDNGTSKVDLTVFLEFTRDGPSLSVEYSTDLFEATTIGRWLDLLEGILRVAVADADLPVSALSEPASEAARVASWNDTARPFSPAALHELVRDVALAHPDRVAATAPGGASLTYGQLLDDAHRLAHRLREMGVCPEVVVGICVERTPDMLSALLGILSAGGAYLPLDPEFPPDRLEYMMRDARAAVLVTRHDLRDRIANHGATVLCLDCEDLSDRSGAPPDVAVDPECLAYLLYTSGSTGRPKGVEISHRSMVNFLESMRATPGLAADDVIAGLTTLSFDIAGLELWLPLLVGARVVVVPHDIASDGAALARLLDEEGVSVLQATPITWRLLLAASWQGRPDLRAWCGGEALTTDLADALRPRVAELWNLYGPTEATIWSTLAPVSGDEGRAVVPIGRPIANTSVWVVDEQLRPVPIGVAGELCIGGAGVARGYRDRPGLTADRFPPDPFGPAGARLYRTGDQARFLADGSLEFLGRNDSQVKVRGFRIELGEIEATLGRLPGVRACAATVWGATAEEQRIVAYVVPDNGSAPPANGAGPTAADLREAARSLLPAHMVPGQIELLDALPLTANRKVDRRALPEPSRPDTGVVRRLPSDPFEEIVAEVWSEVLDIEDIGVDENFFELGGHSLLATRVVSRLGQRFEVPLAVRLVFEAPTVGGLARLVETAVLSDLDRTEAAAVHA